MARGPINIVILWKENKNINLQKCANIQKSQIFFWKFVYQEQRGVEENKTVIKSKF